MSLSNKAILVHLSISQWAGRKRDERATSTVESAHATKGRAGNYTKKLLPGADELAAVSAHAKRIRVYFAAQTLPWFSDGSRILSSLNYMEFTQGFRALRADYDQAVEAFLQAYPALKNQARQELGDLFSEAEYPSTEYLRRRFACEIAFMPVPDVADFRVEILDSEKDEFLKRMREVEANAVKECWSRLYGVVSKAVERLQEPDAVFRDTLIGNITDLCALLPKLNITGDAELEAMRRAVESTVATLSPDTLRKDSTARNEAAKALDDITAKMSAFMGGSNV